MWQTRKRKACKEAGFGPIDLVVRIRPQDAARHGLRTSTVLDAVSTAYQGTSVGQVYDRNRVIDVQVLLEPTARTGLRLRWRFSWLTVCPVVVQVLV